jgi:methylmalonyl-CoA carboxyltransferase small subunit
MRLKITVDGQEYEVDVEVAEPEPPTRTTYIQSTSHAQGAGGGGAPQPAAPEVAADEAKVVRSPLAGVVSKVETVADQEVAADQEILVLEAMKMFTTITSPRAGKIKSVTVAVGDPVKQGQILVEFE